MGRFVNLLAALTTAVSALPAFAQSGTMPTELMSRDEARRVMIGCGLPEQRVSVLYERDMQEDLVWIASDKASLPDSMLACLARASLRTIYYVYFRDEAEQKRYSNIYSEIEDKVEIAEARTWLRDRNRLSAIPIPNKGAPLADYAKAVETFCGVRPGSLLAVPSDDMITFTKNGLGRATPNGIEGAAANTQQFECVMKVMAAADLKSRNILFGLIGNAAAGDRSLSHLVIAYPSPRPRAGVHRRTSRSASSLSGSPGSGVDPGTRPG